MKPKIPYFLCIFFLIAGVASPKDGDFEKKMDGILKNAKATIGDEDHRKSDFWMARYLGQICVNEKKTSPCWSSTSSPAMPEMPARRSEV